MPARAWHATCGSWSATREVEIAKALDTDVFRAATVSSVRCRTTLCSVVLEFDDKESMCQIVRAIPSNPAFASGGFIHYSHDGDTPRTPVFLSRRGETLPMLN